MSSPAVSSIAHRRAVRSGCAAAIGTTIEWYDFYIYATAAALVFPTVFFPEVNHTLGTLASFGTYAVAFFARPVGGIVFGHIGDKYGRKPALTFTLLLMGIATTLVGVVPSYEQIGILGPVMLIVLRIAQGLGVGGEWGGSSLLSVESAPHKWKVFYGGFTQLGNPLGALLCSGVFWILANMGDEAFMSWGWRVPFLLSIVLIGVGLWVRFRVEETPVFNEKIDGVQQSTPILFAIRHNWWPIFLGFCIVAMSTGGYVIATTYVQNYATSPEVGLSASTILGAMTVASFVEALVTLPVAWVGDKIGVKSLVYAGAITSFIAVIPMVIFIEQHNVLMIYILASVMRITLNGAWSPLSTLMTQMFKPQARYTSMSLSYGIGAAVWGGLSPIIATALLDATSNFWSVIGFFGLLSFLALFGAFFAPQHTDQTKGSAATSDEAPDLVSARVG